MKAMKKFFKIVWKGLLGLAVASVALFGVVLGWAWYEDYTSYYNDAFLSDDVMVRHYYSQREHKVYNRQLDKITLKGLDKAVEPVEGDSLTVFFKGRLRGFLNAKTGYVVIPAQYKKAWVFSEGLAAVMNESGKIGFINKDNEVVLPFVYDCRREYPIDYVFRNGLCVMTDEHGACGMIDKEGNWVMEPQYDCIWNLYFDKYRIVKEGEKYGMIDENMKLVFPVEYEAVTTTLFSQWVHHAHLSWKASPDCLDCCLNRILLDVAVRKQWGKDTALELCIQMDISFLFSFAFSFSSFLSYL